jgi:SAM-dependent methyltransferase
VGRRWEGWLLSAVHPQLLVYVLNSSCSALVTEAAAATTPHARHVLDVGCGAGNYTLKLLERLPGLDATLIDLSQPMLDRARERVIPDADVPQAVEPVFQHILATYASEANKTASVWRAVPDALLDFKPHEKTNLVNGQVVGLVALDETDSAMNWQGRTPPLDSFLDLVLVSEIYSAMMDRYWVFAESSWP